MWAGGRLQFHHDLKVGEPIARTSTIADVSVKEGRSGTLVFVLVRHEISNSVGRAISEEHDIVYRDAPQPGDPAPAGRPAPKDSVWTRAVTPDPVLLFRYSALTFNGHRIHYDRNYVTQQEGYPGLIVHGPLIATLLVDLVRRNSERPLAAFRFRAVRPLFDTKAFSVHAGAADPPGKVGLWARDPDGFVAMEAEAELRQAR
jgi:3-methylfumaryl-CoA hydratase